MSVAEATERISSKSVLSVLPPAGALTGSPISIATDVAALMTSRTAMTACSVPAGLAKEITQLNARAERTACSHTCCTASSWP